MTSDASSTDRIRRLEIENTRLRGLLETTGLPSTLRHQVRNALGMMRAILRRSARGKTTIDDFVAHLEGRIDALLRIQTALLSSPDGRIDLALMVSEELVAQAIREGDQARIDGPDIRMGARQAELLGLVIHELATNAIKFGATGTKSGRIDVTWALRQPGHLLWSWVETGSRVDPVPPAVRGFGMEAIEVMLPYQLKAEGRIEFEPDGVRCTIELPLEPP